MITFQTTARVQTLSKYGGEFQAFHGAVEDLGEQVGLFTASDFSTKLLFDKNDILFSEAYSAENKGVFDTTLFVRKGARLRQVVTQILEGEVGALGSCSSGGCSRQCPPGQNCSCSSGSHGCSCSQCV